MAIFGGSREKTATEGGGSAKPSKQAPTAGGLSVIGSGMTVRGDIDSNGVVKVEGVVEGHVGAASQVLVARGGEVRGDIETREAIIGGVVRGGIVSSERVEVQAGAVVTGDITTGRIAVAEGAKIDGHIRMGEPVSKPSAREAPVAEPRAAQSYSRPSVPVARVAVPPRTPSGSGM